MEEKQQQQQQKQASCFDSQACPGEKKSFITDDIAASVGLTSGCGGKNNRWSRTLTWLLNSKFCGFQVEKVSTNDKTFLSQFCRSKTINLVPQKVNATTLSTVNNPLPTTHLSFPVRGTQILITTERGAQVRLGKLIVWVCELAESWVRIEIAWWRKPTALDLQRRFSLKA